MKCIQWGVFSKAQQAQHEEKRDERNEPFVQQRVKLPTGATYTICKPVGDDDQR